MIRTLLFLGVCAIIEKSYGEDFQGHINYLVNYGYLETSEEGGSPDSFSSDEIDSALKMAQNFAGIPATGKLDNQTMKMLSAPRCGFPDTGSRLKRYSTISKWKKKYITYGFLTYSPQLRADLIRNTLRKAFDTWSAPSGLRFSPVDAARADMKIGFFRGNHGDGVIFDETGSILAHAAFPSGGDVHFNEAVKWVINGEVDLNRGEALLQSTATHELGHALGLKHSHVPGAMMKPIYTGRTDLGEDDILGIQSLYKNYG